ncbi:GNAT family N-acetyltransferase [Ectobacillus ponti]|uniref:GNAT family N-acetyltransferase n=1 Tax=Ectobacillus ponti TaxID=2961894 RepID=A0AA41X9K6_9BACI|nr:GNAT family N-acetyltransferase [Ectobacillus ponti]MCP8968880.1 GNAT family N-acetyltransferase [Ectobacillus ponti]
MLLEWKEIQLGDTDGLEQALQLYDEMFPLPVREPHEVFWNGLRYGAGQGQGSFRFLVACEGKQVNAFATGHYFQDMHAAFIVYIAVRPSVRHHGLGSQTLQRMEELLRGGAAAPLRAVILEAEKEELAHDEQERVDCMRRSCFFIRNGYRKYEGLEYVQPPLHAGEQPVPLQLFIKGPRQTSPDVRSYVQAMYREKYAAVNGIQSEVLERCLRQMGLESS